MLSAFVALQGLLILYVALHDWVPVPPFNDLEAMRRGRSFSSRLVETIGNTAPLGLALGLSLSRGLGGPSFAVAVLVVAIFGVYAFGTLRAWWIPYLRGASPEMVAAYEVFERTHRFLPRQPGRIVPDTLHVVLHVQVWVCLGLAIAVAAGAG